MHSNFCRVIHNCAKRSFPLKTSEKQKKLKFKEIFMKAVSFATIHFPKRLQVFFMAY